MASLCLIFPVVTKAQTPAGALQEGQALPDLTVKNVLNYKTPALKLTDFRGKVLVLDFWGTYCGACITMKPVMDSLQKIFKGQIQFVSVASQSRKVIADFLLKQKLRSGWHLSTPEVTEDKVLEKLFPSRYVPNLIWIDRQGIFRAATSGMYLSGKKIQEFLDNGKFIDYHSKIEIDTSVPLFTNQALPTSNMSYFSAFFKGHLEGVGGATYHSRKSGKLTGLSVTNNPLNYIYYKAGRLTDRGFSWKQLKTEVQDPSLIYQHLSKEERSEWLFKNEYSFDLIIPAAESAKLKDELLSLLNKYTGYQAVVRHEPQACLELVKLNPNAEIVSKGGEYLNKLTDATGRIARNIPVAHVTAWLNNEATNHPVIVDHTGLSHPIDLDIPDDYRDLSKLKASLNKQGFNLRETVSPVIMLVVSDKPKTLNHQ